MHEFWNKQPVPQDKVVFEKDGEIDSSRELRYEKTPLPEGYEWSSCEIEELCEFLKENYIRDDFFEFHYSKELVKWSTYKDEWNLVIREKQNSEITGFISVLSFMRTFNGTPDIKPVISEFCFSRITRFHSSLYVAHFTSSLE